MTPQERQMVTELFDRLAKLENTPRDPDAERVMAAGLARAPHAIYPLVQTVLVQDEALKRADARIRELSGEDEAAPQGGGFLDNMRNVLMGQPATTSVPSVRAANEPDPRWNSGAALTPQAPQPVAAPPAQGGSFLGTAAASAAGMIGGALLLNSISSMFGQHGGSAFGAVPPASGSPRDNSATGSDLSRDAGLNDIGGSGGAPAGRGAGLLDSGADDADIADLGGGDLGGDGGGDTA
jgi:hypothetical protein